MQEKKDIQCGKKSIKASELKDIVRDTSCDEVEPVEDSIEKEK